MSNYEKKTWRRSKIFLHSVDGGYLWTVVIKPYTGDEVIASYSSTEPTKHESRARLEALKWILKYLLEGNDPSVHLVFNYHSGNVYDKYIHYVITKSIKWWVDKWYTSEGFPCKNIDMLKVIVPMLVQCFDRIVTQPISPAREF